MMATRASKSEAVAAGMVGRGVAAVLFLLVLAGSGLLGCQQDSLARVADKQAPNLDQWVMAPPAGGGDQAGDPDAPVTPKAEVCNGKDDDLDGEIDEGTDAGSCEDNGTMMCIGGFLQCVSCAPGSSREVDCDCDAKRVDTCDERGVWHLGVCDGCGVPNSDKPCGFCGTMAADGTCGNPGECVPGAVTYRTCDSCPDGASCGATDCVGQKMVCQNDCTWKRIGNCEVRPSECSEDSTLQEPCGACGFQIHRCDGCFWQRANTCEEHGSCFPGAERSMPCSDKACIDGYTAKVSCNEQCEWNQPDVCQGCTPGTRIDVLECIPNHPGCGLYQMETTCAAAAAPDSCNAMGGSETSQKLTDCPPVECQPGETKPVTCVNGDGQTMPDTLTCTNDCTWPLPPPPDQCGGSCECVPGDETAGDEVSCGCGITYTVSKLCGSNCKWIEQVSGKEDCPPCTPGQSDTQSCQNGCGTQTSTCTSTCEWGAPSACDASGAACTPGETQTTGCQAQCGPGHQTAVCNSSCQWNTTSSCSEDSPPACQPGDSRRPAGCPAACTYDPDTCSSGCSWVPGSCHTPCG